MSPEQARGEAVDERADIYALGIMIFEMLAGTVPFDGEDPLAIMAQHVDRLPPPLSSVCRIAIPPLLEAIVQRCLEKSANARYPSAAALLMDLNAVDPNEPVMAPPPPPPIPISRPETLHAHVVPAALPPKRRSTLLRTAVVAAILGVGGGWAAWRGFVPIQSVKSSLASTELNTSRPTQRESEATETGNTVSDGEREIHFVLFPLDARVFKGDQDLGQMPVSMRLPKGETATVTVRRKGFSTRKVVVDGRESRVVIGLVKANEGGDARRHAVSRPATRTESSSKRPPARTTAPH